VAGRAAMSAVAAAMVTALGVAGQLVTVAADWEAAVVAAAVATAVLTGAALPEVAGQAATAAAEWSAAVVVAGSVAVAAAAVWAAAVLASRGAAALRVARRAATGLTHQVHPRRCAAASPAARRSASPSPWRC